MQKRDQNHDMDPLRSEWELPQLQTSRDETILPASLMANACLACHSFISIESIVVFRVNKVEVDSCYKSNFRIHRDMKQLKLFVVDLYTILLGNLKH